MPHCEKCNVTTGLQKHHLYPICHFKTKFSKTIWLCEGHHLKAEYIILGIEAFVGHKQFGERHKLSREEYVRINEAFVHHPITLPH